jgi:N-methylhydantoinase A
MFDIATATFAEAAVVERERLAAGEIVAGPAVINQFDTTTIVLAGQRARHDAFGTLLIEEDV